MLARQFKVVLWGYEYMNIMEEIISTELMGFGVKKKLRGQVP